MSQKTQEEDIEGFAEPFCACGRRWADCDGSRTKCVRNQKSRGLYIRTSEGAVLIRSGI